MNDILSLRGFGVGLGERTILGSIDLAVPEKGVTSVFGPSATGKSTLLRTLAGLNDANPNLRTWGEAIYAGQPLGAGERPTMMVQSAKLMAASILRNVIHEVPERGSLDLGQQRDLAERLLDECGLPELKEKLQETVLKLDLYQNRRLSIMRICASNPKMVCLDEPTTGLTESEARELLDFIKWQATKRAVLITLHNQEHAEYLGGNAVLIAGGYVQDFGEPEALFKRPRTEVAVKFAKTGSCNVPAPDAKPEELDPDGPQPKPLPEAARNYVSDSFGPRGFLWLKKGLLAGTPMPGVFYEEEHDIQALKRVEVTHLVSLTEPPPKERDVDDSLLATYGINRVRFPIVDMGAPGYAQAVDICRHIEKKIHDGEKVAVHCRAGMGRTGTVLCMYLIWEGEEALDALEKARNIEPRWVQSEEQVAFLELFETRLGKDRESGVL